MMNMTNKLTHIDERGNAQMVDVSEKRETSRTAIATGKIYMQPETLQMVVDGKHKKGDVINTARIAGIQAAKQCSNLIPLCHPLMLTKIEVNFGIDIDASCVDIKSECRLKGQTGVEMEALTAVSVAALTLYDMCKAVDKAMTIGDIRLLEKSGGRSGHYLA